MVASCKNENLLGHLIWKIVDTIEIVQKIQKPCGDRHHSCAGGKTHGGLEPRRLAPHLLRHHSLLLDPS